jgi:DNA polymerase-3 subunit delta'
MCIRDSLQAEYDLDAAEARKISHLSGGKIETALRLQNDPAYMEERREQIEELIFLLKSNRRERFHFADRFRQQDSKEKARQILQTWLLFWRDILLTSAGSDVPLVNLDWAEKIRDYANIYDFETARRCVSDLENAIFKIDTTNTNQRLLMEVLMLDWPLP